MKSSNRFSTGFFITTAVAAVAIIAAVAIPAYISDRANCLAFPQKYHFMQTRYHATGCQFRENEGWISFEPSS